MIKIFGKKYKVVNKKRFYFSIFILVVLISFLSIVLFETSKSYAEIKYEPYYEVVVNKGDTLWKIANENIKEDIDTREVIYKIKEINNMETADINEGSRIKIPRIIN